MSTRMTKLQLIYEDTLKKIISSDQEWKSFLRFAAQIHKYPFDQSVLIYAQNPNVTMLANKEIWNQFKRNIALKSKAIQVIKYVNGEQTIEHLFDISQTNGKSIQKPGWEIQDAEKEYIGNAISNNSNLTLETQIDEFTKNTSFDIFLNNEDHFQSIFNNYDKMSYNEQFQSFFNLVVKSSQYCIRNKCGLNEIESIDFSFLQNIDSTSKLTLLGYLVTNTTKEVMSSIANLKKDFIKERNVENDRQNNIPNERGRTFISEHSNKQQSGGQSPIREVRENSLDTFTRNESSTIHGTSNERYSAREDAPVKQPDNRENHTIRGSITSTKSSSSDRGYNGKDEVSKSDQEPSRRDNIERNHIQQVKNNDFGKKGPENKNSGSFILEKNAEEKNENELDQIEFDLFNDWDSIGDNIDHSLTEINLDKSISQKEIDNELIHGSGFEGGKFRIVDFYLSNPTEKDAITFLKNEYGIGSWGGPGRIHVSFDSKGMKLVKGDLFKPDDEVQLKWTKVSKRIRELIRQDLYLSTNEKKVREANEFENAAGEDLNNQSNTTVTNSGVNDNAEILNGESVIEPEQQEIIQAENYYYDISDNLYPNGEKTKYKNNILAIQLLKQLEVEKRVATKEEQKVLARYVGWGGLANVFSSKSDKWSKEYEELKLLLTEQEYREAMESTITAYYTDPVIIEKMYTVLNNLGFKKGNILDPAMGTGNFFSNLPKSMRESNLFGVELDSITGRISRKLYPKAYVAVQGFETTSFKDNQFDVIVGNIPFNNIKITDSRYDQHNFLIHDYFIAKSLDLVKPGGIVAFITSKGTLDKKNTSVREYIAERSDLLGAIRLPNTAFKAIAGTEVTADILFLQKLETKRNLEIERPSWVDTEYYNNEVEMNRYFLEHPEMVIGRMEFDGYYDGGRRYTCVLDDDKDLYSLLDNTIQNIKGTFNAKEDAIIIDKIGDDLSYSDAPDNAKNFTYIVQNNKIYYVENRKLIPREFNKKTSERIKGLCEIRKALTDVINIQLTEYNPSELKDLQKVLNERYDEFVLKYGYINDPVNKKAFYEDDQLPLLLSVEDLNKDKTYSKAPIFNKATIRPQVIKTTADTAKEALEMSMNYKINVDLEYMSRIYNKEPEKIIEELGDLIYLNPEKFTGNLLKGWEFRDEYLSGNVYDKLQYAKQKAEDYPELFQRNVAALEDVQPPRLLPGDIHFRIGSSWIPEKYYQEFMYETFETAVYNKFGSNSIQLNYIKYTNTWRVQGKHQEPSSVKVNSVFGTNRKNAYELFEDCLNLQDTTVRDPETYVDDLGREQVKYVVNPKETMIARSKQQDIQQAFSTWLFSEPKRSQELLDIYNCTFNTIRPRHYDGSYLSFPEMNEEMELRPHQKNVVSRILSTGNALMAHEVGAGKTAAMIAAGMKLKQIGAVKKPMFVVMNHTIEQWATEFMRFYPGANILVTTKEDFKKQNRKKFVSKIAVGEYDAIIIGHSQFEKISLSKERQESSIRKDISTLSYEIGEAKKNEGKDWSVKQLVVFQKRLQERLTKLQNNAKKDDLLNFEELGVDALFVDEAHNYKNLFTMTKLNNVAGIGTSSSQRASDMKMKVEYIQELNNCRGIIFATGTPVTNSMSELHVMQRYLQPEVLKRAGLEFFDKWAGTFGEVETTLEMTPEGGGYRMRSRFSKFHNLPELMNTFHLVADIQTADMLKLPVPKLDGGKAKIIVSPMSDFQKAKMDEFVDRSEDIRNGVVDPSTDNMLKLTNEAKLMAIDPRLIDENAPVDENSKLSICANKVYEIWEETEQKRLTQIIFCDSGTPKPNKFNAYDEMKRQLIEKGVPKEEIAFIHDAKTDEARDKLFEKVRNGEIRVILGSTSKVGTGTNIQDRLIAAHHIDCPWRPADLIQRDGRIIRQGNINEKVSIYRYVTKGTFDGYLWQIQEQKNRYISQVMTGKNISRSVDDLDETVLTAAEVKAIATDNPLLLEKMNLDNEVNRLKLIRNRWMNERVTMQQNLDKTLPDRIRLLEKQRDDVKGDLLTVESYKNESFKIVIDGHEYFDEKDAGIALSEVVKAKPFEKDNRIQVGFFKGMNVYIERDVFGDQQIGLQGNKRYSRRYMKYEKNNIEGLSTIIESIRNELDILGRKLDETKQQIIDIEKELKTEFPQEKQYQELIKKQSDLNLKMQFENDLTETTENPSKKCVPKDNSYEMEL